MSIIVIADTANGLQVIDESDITPDMDEIEPEAFEDQLDELNDDEVLLTRFTDKGDPRLQYLDEEYGISGLS